MRICKKCILSTLLTATTLHCHFPELSSNEAEEGSATAPAHTQLAFCIFQICLSHQLWHQRSKGSIYFWHVDEFGCLSSNKKWSVSTSHAHPMWCSQIHFQRLVQYGAPASTSKCKSNVALVNPLWKAHLMWITCVDSGAVQPDTFKPHLNFFGNF